MVELLKDLSESLYWSSFIGYFQVGILPEKVSCIKKIAYQEDHAEQERENGSDGIGDIVDRIFDSPDLRP
jgi:hypothetical protein